MGLPKLPSWPKGLKARLKKAQKKSDRLAAVAKRRKEIKAAQDTLRKLQDKNTK